METKVSEQQTIAEGLQRLISNIKKDPAARKTAEYLQNRADLIQAEWDKFKINHKTIKKDLPKDHNYLTNDYYKQTESLYQEGMQLIDRYTKRLEEAKNLIPQTTENVSNQPEMQCETDDESNTLIRKQTINIQLFHDEIKEVETKLKTPQGRTFRKFQEESLKEMWKEISDLHREIMVKYGTSQYVQNNTYSKYKTKYVDLMAKLMESDDSQGQQYQNKRLQLPTLNIPIFDGKVSNWLSFKDMFTTMIHKNEDLSGTEKIQYLKAYVQGEANKLIQHLPTTAGNYEAAFKLITNRYDNKRMLFSNYMGNIMALNSPNPNSANSYKTMHDITRESMYGIENLDLDQEEWGSYFLAYILINKFDSETKIQFERSLSDTREVPQVQDVLNFVEKQFQALEASRNPGKKIEYEKTPRRFEFRKYNVQSNVTQVKKCPVCKENHKLTECTIFLKMSVSDRIHKIKNLQLCYNCLLHPNTSRCLSRHTCHTCQKPHHSLLHREYIANQPTAFKRSQQKKSDYQEGGQPKFSWQKSPNQYNDRRNETNKSQKESDTQENKLYTPSTSSNHIGKSKITDATLLATAFVLAKKRDGTYISLRALVDNGSQASFITESASQLLGQPRMKQITEVAGVGQSDAGTSKYKIKVELKSMHNDFRMFQELLVLPKITGYMPNETLSTEKDEAWKNIALADEAYARSAPIDMLIGIDGYINIIESDIIKSKIGLVAQKTKLGYIIFGKGKRQPPQFKITSMVTNTDLEDKLQKFWELEEIPETKPMKENDKKCEEHFEKTHIRDENGKYKVRIPFNNNKQYLGSNRKTAIAQLYQIEKKFKQQQDLAVTYKTFMAEYEQLGHMSLIKTNAIPDGYYIPHQAVINESKETTKMRVVFNASCPSNTGLSLNDVMHQGPTLQTNLGDILLRWRSLKYVCSADIEKMYRMVDIHESDREYQKILWRFSENDPIQIYQLNTITYGTRAAPYLAIKTLKQLAEDEKLNYPRASKLVHNSFYVDDVLTGADTVKETEEIRQELTELMTKGGFNLRKWRDNITPGDPIYNLALGEEPSVKTLGLYWKPSTDTFQFKIKKETSNKITKRQILSEIAAIFDPLGLLSPVTINAKILMQTLWKEKYSWDEQLPEKTQSTWKKFREELKQIENISIPRWVQTSPEDIIELHTYCDASPQAYAAVIYVKTIKANKNEQSILLTAKAKVAPIKTKRTLPQLELQSALLLANLINQVTTAMNWKNKHTVCYSDSTIAISWIIGKHNTNNFVSNRVNKIKQLIPSAKWKYVRSSENLADIATRQNNSLDKFIISHSNWFNAPINNNTTNTICKLDEFEENKVVAHDLLNVLAIKTKAPDDSLDLIKLCDVSSWNKIIRIIAYCIRFISNTRNKSKTLTNLTREEISKSKERIYRDIQKRCYPEEIYALQNSMPINKKSTLLSLSPILDENNVMRVGGRLQNAPLSYNEKHPIIIPSQHEAANLIIKDAHKHTLHGGVQQTMAYIRQTHWITRCKIKVKSVLRQCVICARYNARTLHQQMGPLPPARVTPSHAFTHTGIDYCGPIKIKLSNRRGAKSYKGYIAVFVCLSTKAIHIEAVSDLSTEAFLAAFRRFTSRRGLCSDIYSDNGTNFVGAKNTMDKELRQLIEEQQFKEAIEPLSVKWHFIPPASPHFGGIWEAGVKSIKYHLKRIVGNNTLTFEEMTTLLCQIEANLNSRPLLPLDENPSDGFILTPGHFLIGHALNQLPENSLEFTNPTKRWKLIQKLKGEFWKQWTTEYLSRLQQRTKWKLQQENINIGDIVLIKHDNIDPNNWPLARVIETHPGADKNVRVVTLKTKDNKSFKRPITKLCLLPIDTSQNKESEEVPNMKEETSKTSRGNRPKTNNACSTILAMLSFLTMTGGIAAQTNYEIKGLQPGLYVEHIGEAYVNRGNFKIGLNFSMTQVHQDEENLNKTVDQFNKLCSECKQQSNLIKCDEFYHHILAIRNRIYQDINSITDISNIRTKRGLLGKFMTSIFGVNENVYHNINDLRYNQDKLISITNHQGKILVKSMSTINETESRIYAKLENFRRKFNQGLDAVNEMKGWFTSIKPAELNIHILHAFQLAQNYLEEMAEKYQNLNAICYSQGHISKFIPTSKLHTMIQDATTKLPSSLKIIQHPNQGMEIAHDEDNIKIFAKFYIIERIKFDLLKANPVPEKTGNNTFAYVQLQNSFLAAEYNTQKYFEVQDQQLQNAVRIQTHTYILNPSVIRHIESSPDCLLGLVYRNDSTKCAYTQLTIQDIIWKELSSPNTWLYVTTHPVRVAIICSGQRREEFLHNHTGIIKINSHCSIETKHTILQAKNTENISFLGSYNKIHKPELMAPRAHDIVHNIKQETVLQQTDTISKLQDEASDVAQDIQTTTWVHLQSAASGGGTTIIILVIIAILYILNRKQWLCFKKKIQSSQSQPVIPAQNEFLLRQMPEYSQPEIRPTTSHEST